MEVRGIGFEQEGITFFSTAMRAEDLLRQAKVDVYRQEEGVSLGYQRTPELARARAFSRYLQTQAMPLAPTSILINVREGLVIEEEAGFQILELPEDAELWIMDGQHRLEGFRYAIETQEISRMNDYTIPVVFASGLDVEQEADQFRVINETAKKVRTDLARRLLAISARSKDGRQQVRAQQRMWEANAADVIEFLNTNESSPLRGKIQPPNEKKTSQHTVRELSFSTSLRPILTTFPYQDWRPERVAEQLSNYWKAWETVVPEVFENPQDHVLLKTAGAFSLHQVAMYIWEVCRRAEKDPTTIEVVNMLQDLESSDSRYWESDNIDGAAVFGSMKGFSILADSIKDDLFEHGFRDE